MLEIGWNQVLIFVYSVVYSISKRQQPKMQLKPMNCETKNDKLFSCFYKYSNKIHNPYEKSSFKFWDHLYIPENDQYYRCIFQGFFIIISVMARPYHSIFLQFFLSSCGVKNIGHFWLNPTLPSTHIYLEI